MLKDYSIVAWGGYQYFNDHIESIREKVKVEYIFGNLDYIKNKEDYKLLADKEKILELKNPFVIICLASVSEVSMAAKWCRDKKIPYCHMEFLFNKNGLSSKYLKAVGGKYTDWNQNTISISQRATDNIFIDVSNSKNADIHIENISVKERLKIKMLGHHGYLSIGEKTTVVFAYIVVNTCGKIIIGKDCMLANAVSLMQSDQHLIFDRTTKKRINYPKDIVVGNHVWIGREVELLAGAEIGDGCVCGARTVTSGKFPANAVLAGSPAKVIRENVIWARDLIETSDFDSLEQCKDQNGVIYQNNNENFPVNQKRKDPLEEMIIHLYQSGITTVGISKLIEKMYGQYYVPKEK